MEIDRLQEFLNYQRAFQMQRGKFTGLSPIEETKELILWMHSELSELLNELNLKVYSIDTPEIQIANIQDEIIDIFKYCLIQMNIWGMNSDDVYEEFYRKSAVVEQKWKQILDIQLKDKHCVCVDIDGVLCDSHGTWIKFLCTEGILTQPDNIDYYSLDFSDYLPDEKRGFYSSLKSRYRESGIKKEAILYPSAQDCLRQLSQKYQVVLVSARPIEKHRRIYADTIEWLKKNDLYYDAIMFESDKRKWVLDNLNKVAFCVEDDPSQAQRLANVGLKVFLLDKPYNQDLNHSNIQRIQNLGEIKC